MAKSKIEELESHANLSVIRDDIETLKKDVVEGVSRLAKDVKEEGMNETRYVKKKVHDQIDTLRGQLEELEEAAGRRYHTIEKRVEKHVKSNPTQSVAMAFAAGIITSFLLGRRN